MEKLLDRPRAFEESRMRCILALEAQKRAQILVISNAQRKLVSNFQQKLKSSATVAETHSKWIQNVKTTRQKIKLEVERNAPEARRSKTKTGRGKARPKTTGANKKERMLLHGDVTSVVDLTRRSEDASQLMKPREGIVNYTKEALQKYGNETYYDRGSEMKGCIDVYNSKSCEHMLADSSSVPTCHKLWHTDTNLSEVCMKHENEEAVDRTSFEATLDCFGTCSLEARDDQKLISGIDFGGCEATQKSDSVEHLPVIDSMQNRDSELCVYTSSSRSQLLRKPESVDANTLSMTGLSMNEKYGTLEIRSKALEHINYSTSGNHGYVDDHKTSKSIIKAPSSNEKSSVNSTRSGKKTRQSHGLLNGYRSDSGCTVGCREQKMSFELRTWISNIKKDVRRVHSCMEGTSLNANSKELAHANSWMSENSSVSSTALEKFDAIFRGSYVNDARFENSDYEGRRELVDATSLYGKAAVVDAKLDTDQKWHKRDPRNKKLKPSILL